MNRLQRRHQAESTLTSLKLQFLSSGLAKRTSTGFSMWQQLIVVSFLFPSAARPYSLTALEQKTTWSV